MSLTRKVAYNTIVQIVGKVVTTALSLVLIGYLTRYLGVAGYGQYTTIFAYVSFWSVLADFGFFTITVREISKNPKQTSHIFNNVMTLRAILGLLVFSVSFAVALLIPQYSWPIKIGIGLCATSWFWTTLNSTYVGIFQANLKMDRSVFTEILGRIIILLLTLFYIKSGYGLTAIISAYLIGNIINFFASMILGLPWVKFKFAFDFKFWKEIFLETLPMGTIIILGMIYFKADTVILSLMKSSTDVGIYGAPFKIFEILLLIPTMFMGNVFPIITRYIAQKDNRLISAIQKSYDFIILLVFPIVLGVFILAKPIIRFIAGEIFVTTSTIGNIFGQVAAAPMVLQILIFTVGLNFVMQVFNNCIIAASQQKKLVIPYIIFVIVNVGLNLLLIPKFSYIGAAISTFITALMNLIVAYWVAHKSIIDLNLKQNIIIKSLFSSFVMGLVIYYFNLQNFNLFLSIIVGFFSYFILMILVKGITKQQFQLLFKK
jgi:O-antigen/teichoic acid export membrane protein